MNMRVLEPAAFIPEAWRDMASAGPLRMFNPGLIRHGGRRLLAYRLVFADGRRRIAICALDDADRPVPETLVPLSDMMAEAGPWQADPRLCTLGPRLFLHFNNGDLERPNSIFLTELDADTLTPLTPARPLERPDGRRPVEKNWTLFSVEDNAMLAVYSIRPHVVMTLDLDGSGPVPCRPVAQVEWTTPDPAAGLGEPRGGTTPVRIGDVFYSFFHMHGPAPAAARLAHRLRQRMFRLGGRHLHRYHIGFYGFSAHPPYRPLCFTPAPVFVTPPRPRNAAPALNRDAQRVLYPTGALYAAGTWTVAAGLHDDRCCLLTLDHAQLLASAEPVG